MRRRGDRGLTFVTVLLGVAVAFGGLWLATYGPAYWENIEVSRVLKEAANMSYRQPDEHELRNYVFRELHHLFYQKIEDHGRVTTEMRIDVDEGGLRIERIQLPAYIHIWLTYSRDVHVPLLGQQRRVTFND